MILSEKRKIILTFCFTLCLLSFAFCSLYAQAISSQDLIDNTKFYDGKTIVYEGEVIGDIMARGKFAWLNLHDGRNAVGIWADKNLTRDIFYAGSYKSKGDWLEVTGIFYRACPEHGGDLDIHALAIKKISPGRKMPERLIVGKRNLVFILLGILAILWILSLLKRS